MQMRFFSKLKESGHNKQLVLILCVENAGRSQMAEGTYTMPSTGTMTIDGIKYHGQPGLNFTPDFKVLSIENSTWYMIK